MSYTSSASARFANPSVPSIKAKGFSSCMKLNQVSGVEGLTRDQNNPVSVELVESSYGPIHIAYTASMAVRAGVKYASVVLFLSDVLSARKPGVSYSRTEGSSRLCSYQFLA